jgi:hypothetical protein
LKDIPEKINEAVKITEWDFFVEKWMRRSQGKFPSGFEF